MSSKGSETPPSSPPSISHRKSKKDEELVDAELEKEYIESVRKQSAKGRTLTSVGGGLLLAAGGTLVNPLLAIPAAIVGISAGYKMYKERERNQVDKAEKLLATGDHAADNLPGEEGSSRPPLRRLIFLVRWASLQVATDLDNGDLKPIRLERVFDETILSFSAWVQGIYLTRAERSKTKRDQAQRLLKLHLSPLVRWLGSSPSNEVLMMVNHEFGKEAVAAIKSNNTKKDESRIVRRCRAVFPLIVEVYQLFKLEEESKVGQLVFWITDFLRKKEVSSFLAEAVFHPSRLLTAVSVQMDDDDDSVEFPPLGVEQELDDDEFFSASEGEEEAGGGGAKAPQKGKRKDQAVNAHIVRQLTKAGIGAVSTTAGSVAEGVPDEIMFQQTADPANPDPNTWTPLDATELHVRGSNYLEDRVKVLSQPAMFEMLCFDLFYTDFPIHCVSTNKHCKAYWLLKEDPNLFLFTINWRLHPMQATVTYGIRKNKCEWIKDECPERILIERFLEGTTEFRNQAIKVIPKVTEGPWLVRKAVGQTPAILGRKLKVDYHEDTGRFFEAEYDVLSTTAAKSMIGLVVGAAKRLVIDVGLLLEGKEVDELPERVLGGFRIHFPNLSTCRRITLGAPVDPPKKSGMFTSVNSDESDLSD